MALSVAAYAKHRGVSRQSVYKAIKSGRIVANDDGKVDPVSADAAWDANTDPAKGGKETSNLRKRGDDPDFEVDGKPATPQRTRETPLSGIPFDYQRLRSQKLATEIAKGQLALKEAQGALVKRDEVRSALFARARQDRDMVLNFSSRHGASIAAELNVDPRLLMAALDKHLRLLLKEMSEQTLELAVGDELLAAKS